MTTCLVVAIDWTGRSNGFDPGAPRGGVINIAVCSGCPPGSGLIASLAVAGSPNPTTVAVPRPNDPHRVCVFTVDASASAVEALNWFPDVQESFELVKIVEQP